MNYNECYILFSIFFLYVDFVLFMRQLKWLDVKKIKSDGIILVSQPFMLQWNKIIKVFASLVRRKNVSKEFHMLYEFAYSFSSSTDVEL